MKKIIVVLSLFLGFISQSQSCNFKINELDAFSKNKRILTNKSFIAGGETNNIMISFSNDQKIELIFNVSVNYNLQMIMSPENKFLILLKNGKILNFLPSGNIKPIFNGDGGLLSSNDFIFKIVISKTELEEIRNVGFEKFRLQTNLREIDIELVKQKKIDKMNFDIDCFLKELQ